MRILGVDGGLAHMGLALASYDGKELQLEGLAVSKTSPSARKHGIRRGDDNMRRAREQARVLATWVTEGQPDLICYEAQSFGMKGQIAMKQAATSFGLLAAIAELRNLGMLCVSPQEIKKAMCPTLQTVGKHEVIGAAIKRFPKASWPTVKADFEHAADAIGAVVACLRDELVLAVLTNEQRKGA